MAGEYSIADILIYADTHTHGVECIGSDDYTSLKRWHDVIEVLPAVQRAWGLF